MTRTPKLPEPERLTPDEWLQIIGLLANIQTRRFRLTRNGEDVELTPEEESAFARARLLWASDRQL